MYCFQTNGLLLVERRENPRKTRWQWIDRVADFSCDWLSEYRAEAYSAGQLVGALSKNRRISCTGVI